MFWLFEAVSLEALRVAASAAGMTADRIVEATAQDLGGGTASVASPEGLA